MLNAGQYHTARQCHAKGNGFTERSSRSPQQDRRDFVRNIFLNILAKLYLGLKKILNAGIPLKFVVILCALVGFFTYLRTHNTMLRAIGGNEEFEEAKRYIEIKDLVDEHYIDEVDRAGMADSAAAAMIVGLGDPWSYFMTADEYKAYQLSTANDYADIGFSIVKDNVTGGFQVISVYPASPAAMAGLGTGMIITAVDGQNLANFTTDEVRTLVRSKLHTML